MKIYTKQGDQGQTGVVGGARLEKDDVRIEAYGSLDELSAAMGVAAATRLPSDLAELIRSIQHELFVIGSELATVEPAAAPVEPISEGNVLALETAIDRLDGKLAPLKNFILPHGSSAAASLHLARAVCRRAERRVVSLVQTAEINRQIIPYLNRLSDLLFVMARFANQSEGIADIPWTSPNRT